MPGHFIIDCGCGLGGMEGVQPATAAEALAREHAQRHADQTREVLRAYYSDPDYHETPILADREETSR